MRRVVVLLSVLGIALVAYLGLRTSPPPPSAPVGHGGDAGAAAGKPGAEPIAPATGQVAPKDTPVIATTVAKEDWLVFPDGSRQPPLNGVTKAPKITWHRMLPFTPVVRVETDASGRQWYVHENGARSTTYVDARGVAIAEVSLPAPSALVVDEPDANGGATTPK